MPAQTTTSEPAPPPEKLALASQARAQRRQRQRLQLLALVLGSYTIDTLLLLALAGFGVIATAVPWAYAAAGLAACSAFFVLLRSDWCERQSDHYLVVPQMLANAAISLAFILWVPEIGGLLLMLLFVNFAFGALRVGLQPVLVGALLISVVVGAVIALVGDRIALPMADGTQRALSGLWFALVLARSAMLGTYSANLRALLVKRNVQLADTFERLELLANRDELTGALNRRSVLRLLDEERERMQRTGQQFGVALLDIDHFRQVNDIHGHIVGDDVLRRFALKVAAELRGTDRLGRYGGEEFLLLLTGVPDINAAAAVTTRVRVAVADHHWTEVRRGLDVTLSAGVAVCRPGESIEQLLTRTDLALAQAKHDGRNCVRIG